MNRSSEDRRSILRAYSSVPTRILMSGCVNQNRLSENTRVEREEMLVTVTSHRIQRQVEVEVEVELEWCVVVASASDSGSGDGANAKT